jgi:hypothetical protein
MELTPRTKSLEYDPSFQLGIACFSSRHARWQGCWRRRSRTAATNREERAVGKKNGLGCGRNREERGG